MLQALLVLLQRGQLGLQRSSSPRRGAISVVAPPRLRRSLAGVVSAEQFDAAGVAADARPETLGLDLDDLLALGVRTPQDKERFGFEAADIVFEGERDDWSVRFRFEGWNITAINSLHSGS